MPRFYSPPKSRCQLCKYTLYGEDRYKVYLILRRGPLQGALFKKLVVCFDCLLDLKEDENVNHFFKVRYKKMRPL